MSKNTRNRVTVLPDTQFIYRLIFIKTRFQKEGGRVETVQKPGRQHVPRALKIHLRYHQAHTVHIQIDFCKVSIKGDTSETSFRFQCKIAFLAPRTSHVSNSARLFDLVPSRIDSSKCLLQNKVLAYPHIFLAHQMTQMAHFSLKRPKNRQKVVKNTPKRPKNHAKIIAK